LQLIKNDQTKQENKTPYLKSRDRVYIRTETDYFLRSQDITFEINEKDTEPLVFQEVVGHKEMISRSDEVLLFI
jgi:hypothetical protein